MCMYVVNAWKDIAVKVASLETDSHFAIYAADALDLVHCTHHVP